MFPFKTSIQLDRTSNQALYLQLANQIIQHIKDQTLAPNTKLPSSRALAEQLDVHRKTVVACYEELVLQGWIESIPKKGTYVLGSMPILHKQKLKDLVDDGFKAHAGFPFYRSTPL